MELTDLRPDPKNRRAHTPRNLEMLADALRDVGASRSIVIDETGEILAGNGVVEAASRVGLTKLQIVDVDGETLVAVRRTGLTDEQKRALAMFDNRTAELSTWNADQLRLDAAGGLNLKPYWTDREMAKLLGGEVAVEGHTEPDAVPPERATTIVRGDVFDCGRHRVLCGDSSDPAAIARLMGDETAALVWGDPPYGIALDAATADRRIGFYGGSAIDERSAPWDGTLQVDWITAYARVVSGGGYLASWGPYQGSARSSGSRSPPICSG